MLIFTIKESNGDKAKAPIVAEHRQDSQNVYHKTDTATQTEWKTEGDASTQTGDYDEETTTAGPVEGVASMETATTEGYSLSQSVVVIAEAVFEETADEEPLDNQTEIIPKEAVIMENNAYENIAISGEWVEIIDKFEFNHIKNSEDRRLDETDPKRAEPNPNELIIVGETKVAKENNAEETVPLEIPSGMADCVEAVFTAVSHFPDFAVVKPADPNAAEVITEGNSEGAKDVSADGLLIDTTELKSNGLNPEDGEANCILYPDDEPQREVCEDATPANLDMTGIPLKVQYACEKATTDDVLEGEDGQEKSEELIIASSPSSELNSIEEYISDVDETAEVSDDSIADDGLETAEEIEPSPAIFKGHAVETPEAAIENLFQALKAITAPEPAVDIGILLEEEIAIATMFVPLSGEQEENLTIPEEQKETFSGEVNEEGIDVLSSRIEAILAEDGEDVLQMDSMGN